MRAKWAIGLGAVLLAALGCSALVDPEGLITRCEVQSGEADPCSKIGKACMGGTCQECDPNRELCDGRDNDCDGMVDEGHDVDGDGFTWCGGGRQELVDCEPEDPDIHPSVRGPDDSGRNRESCDGLDNDCDGDIDEDPECGDVRECDDGECPDGLTCDADRELCVAPRGGGSPCTSDAQCEGGFCVSTSALGIEDAVVSGLCATACCTDSDCAGDSVCVQAGTGARACLPVDIAGRQNREEGERCSRSFECASGVCQDRRCVSTCSRDADCGDATCRLNIQTSSLLEGASGWICGSPGGRGDAGALCTAFDPTSCQSALCLAARCIAPCGSDGDCPDGTSCRYVEVQGLLGGGRVTACVAGTSDNMQPCCTTGDCGSEQTCRPVQDRRVWGMYCR